ncbi:MAG: hypothetical protein JWQ10_4006 [Herbaspirillum sp.]|nr:hypothetical protein [Herbaspirillum sp.]
MPQPLESVLGQAQRDSLEIHNLIFHIIDPEIEEDDHVLFLDEVELQEKQKAFFLDRLRDIAEGTQYKFLPEAVSLKEKCELLLDDAQDFNQISRQITRDFAGRHQEQMSAGVFVIAVVTFQAAAHNSRKLILMVKMDRRPSFSYKYELRNGRKIAVMEEVPNALSETKAAVQKSAVVDVTDHFAWDVLAFDRVKKPLLSDYFKAFLGVTARHQDSELTRIAHGTVKKWAGKLAPEAMPEGEDLFSYTGRAFNYLNDHAQFDTDAFIDAVIKDQNSERKDVLVRQLKDELALAGVAGQQFVPRPGSIPKKQSKQVYQTAEGVTITFEGDKDAVGLRIEAKPDGGKILTIETNQLSIKQ